MKIILNLILGTLIFLGAARQSYAQNIEDKKIICMMQDSVMEKPGIPIEHAGKTYYGCCSMCSEKIKSEPEKYTKALDPISGCGRRTALFLFLCILPSG